MCPTSSFEARSPGGLRFTRSSWARRRRSTRSSPRSWRAWISSRQKRALADANVTLAGEMGRERRLRVAMEGAGGAYDFVLVDTAPTRSLLTTNVLNFVEEVLVPIAPGLFGVLGLGQLQADVSAVRRFLDNKALRIGGIFLTMTEKNNVAKDLEGQLRQLFGGLVFRTKIPRSVKLEEAHSRHESILTYAPKSRGGGGLLGTHGGDPGRWQRGEPD